MAKINIGETALTGFRVVRQHPKAVAVWAGVQLVVGVCMALLLGKSLGAMFAQMGALNAAGGQPDPAQMGEFFRALAPIYGFGLLFMVIYYPVVFALMSRVVLRPSESRFAYLRLGGDELRQLGMMVLLALVFIGVEIAIMIGGVIIGIIAGMVLKGAGGGNPAFAVVLVPGVMLLFYGLMIFITVRLSLASPHTFATGKMNPLASWRLTKGRFWPMLGVYFIVVLLIAVIEIVGFTLIFAVTSLLPGGGFSMFKMMTHPEMMANIGTYYTTPAGIVYLILGALLGTIMLPVMFTPAPEIYRQITSGQSVEG